MLSQTPLYYLTMSAPERHVLLQKYRTNLYTRSLKTVSKEKMLQMLDQKLKDKKLKPVEPEKPKKQLNVQNKPWLRSRPACARVHAHTLLSGTWPA